MRKLLLLVALVIPTFAWAQNRHVKAALAEATVSCEGDAVPRLGPDGKIALICLPTSTGVLSWDMRGDDLAVSATVLAPRATPSLAAGTIVHLACAACVSLTDCSTAASATINLDARAFSTQHTAGTDLHTSELTCDQDGFSTTTFAGDASNAANEVWNLSISAITDATILRVWATVERTE
jgi:hypothetical protein